MLKTFLSSKPAVIITILLSTLLFSSAIGSISLVKRLELWSFDTRMQWLRAEAAIDDDIAIILIDEASIKAMEPIFGRFPWPRTAYAELLDFISLGEPKAVIFDLLFSERELNSRSGELGRPDQDFVDATGRYPYVVHAAQMFSDSTQAPLKENEVLALPDEFVKKFSQSIQGQNTHSINNSFVIPIPGLWQAAAGIGVVNIESDLDGVYRRVPLFHEYGGRVYPSLSMSAIMHLSTDAVQRKTLTDWLRTNTVTTDYMVNMYGAYKPYSVSGVFSSWNQLQNGEVENLLIRPEEFRGKYVFIGASAVGLDDIKATAISTLAPGVTIHASALSNLLAGDALHEIPSVLALLSGLLIAWYALWLILYSRYYYISYLVPLSLVFLYIYFAFVLFSFNYVIDVIAPILMTVMSVFMAASYKAITEGRDRRRVKHMFSQYVSTAVLDKLLDTYEDTIKAGDGTRERITILFSDIRGFTDLSEKLTPEQVVELLNIYLSEMSNIIMKYEGTIDKYIGDAIMAFWGAPMIIEDHAEKAMMASMDMINGLVGVNETLALKGYGKLKIGVGLHTGSAILGNIGSENKLDYTVIGDAVNLASRVEGLTKQYGCALLVTEDTKNELGEEFHLGAIDAVRVKGKQIPIKLYAPPVDFNGRLLTGAEAEHDKTWMDKGFEAFVARDWSTAIEAYKKIKNQVLSNTYIERCEHYMEQAPADDWDGVFVHKTK